MSLADELAEIASRVAICKAQLDLLSFRLINRLGNEREQRSEQGRLMGECLSHRLAMLYKIEEHWPEVIAALRREP